MPVPVKEQTHTPQAPTSFIFSRQGHPRVLHASSSCRSLSSGPGPPCYSVPSTVFSLLFPDGNVKVHDLWLSYLCPNAPCPLSQGFPLTSGAPVLPTTYVPL